MLPNSGGGDQNIERLECAEVYADNRPGALLGFLNVFKVIIFILARSVRFIVESLAYRTRALN